MKCFYHNDNDGIFAARCVHAWWGIPSKDITLGHPKFVAIDYNDTFPMDTIHKGELVVIVDYSLKPDMMHKLLEITEDVVWIDHHKTAIEMYHDFDRIIRGVRQDGEAACVLTWKYIHWWSGRGGRKENFANVDPDIPVARAIELVGDRDVWKWEFGDDTKFFHAGIQAHDLTPDSDFLFDMLTNKPELVDEVIEHGKCIQAYREKFYKRYLDQYMFEVELDGHKCLALNAGMCGSEAFGDKFEEYPIVITFVQDGLRYIVSLFSHTVDVSEIAKANGGGGHANASGFVCWSPPWTLPVNSK
jgi:oligoribonuclease NrnB/cAMP/cGMP phosphodiesterase (DHH superfamily)